MGKMVQFCANQTIATSIRLTDEEIALLWYTASELHHMREEARHTCHQIRPEIEKLTSGYARDGEETRGLESRACRHRQHRKVLLVRCVLKAQRSLDAYKLACLSYKCSHKAAVVALEEASRDFSRAYMDDILSMKRPLVNSGVAARDSPCGATNALVAAMTAAENRRVRPRVASV